MKGVFKIMTFNLHKCFFRHFHYSNISLSKENINVRRIEPISMSYNIYNSHKENNGNLTPLVIMHGLFGSKNNWNSISKAINNQTGRKVITVDARNHGESPHSDEFSYYHLVEDVNYLLKSMNISQACILGHSMGGRVMMLYAHAYPQNVDKLIVVDITHKSPGSQMTGMSIYFDAMKKVNLNKELSMSEGRRQANDQLSLFIQDPDVRQFLLTNLIKDQDQFKWRLNINVLEKAFSTEITEFPSIATTFNKPTLFIGGKKSSYLKIDDHNEVKKMFPNVIFEYLDAGHWVHAEKPHEFLKLVHDFLQ